MKHLAIHNCRGVVTSLLQTELPFDRSCKLIWAQIAQDMKLASGIDIIFDRSCKLIWAQIAQDMKLASGIDIIFDPSCKLI